VGKLFKYEPDTPFTGLSGLIYYGQAPEGAVAVHIDNDPRQIHIGDDVGYIL
jgi:hypothetical protein